MHPSTALARVLVDEFLRCGLADAVLAPGSRSAPLAMALHDRTLHETLEEGNQRDPGRDPQRGQQQGRTGAGAARRLRLHVRIDERSAGYLALGLAKGSGRPAAVLCTSGTAAANLHPAVIEAGHARVPLLVLTADRPPELRGTGANQTIDQIKLYGDAVRWFCEVGPPQARPGMVAYWRSLACRAWATASGPDPGPVHLNLPFPEPLVPDGDPDGDLDDGSAWPESLDGRASGGPWTTIATAPAGAPPHAPDAPTDAPSAAVPAALSGARRGVLVAGAGDYDPAPFVAAAQAAGWPVLADPSSDARQGSGAIAGYHYLLSTPGFLVEHRPDVVVTVGKPGLSRPLLGFLQDAPEQIVIDPGPRWADPTRSATHICPPFSGTALPPSEPGWMEAWRHADQTVRRAVDAILDHDDLPSEPRLARDLVAAMPDGALLVVGSSMPIRDVDQTMRPRRGLRILANRGASGVDGLVSTAVGAALAHGGPAFALLGDLALLHDHNGLVLGPEEPRPDLAIVVVNNDGGGIFSLLPQAAHRPAFERVFGTPHGVDLAALATACGVGYARLTHMADLPELVAMRGLRLVEVRTDREENAALHARLREAAADALEEAGLTRTG